MNSPLYLPDLPYCWKISKKQVKLLSEVELFETKPRAVNTQQAILFP